MYAQSEKGHASERKKNAKTPLALCVHEDVAVRHEQLLVHADACRQSAVRLVGCVCVFVCVCSCVFVCVRETEREREKERAREREREREKERERERESVCVQSEKGHASERNQTHENTARSARIRRCCSPTRTAAAACRCLPTERCTTDRLVCSVFQLSSLWHRLIAKSQRSTMFSSKMPESAEGIG